MAAPQVVATQVQDMFGSIAPKYDLTNSVLSFGIHHIWKRLVVRAFPLPTSSTILDLCTGTGDLLPLLLTKFSRVIGADFCLPMLVVGKQRPAHSDIPILQGDALGLPFKEKSFDGVTVAFGVRNLEVLGTGLKEMLRVIRPGGYLVVLEFGQPDGIFFGPLYRLYSKWIMPLIGGSLTGNSAAYSYLPETARAFPCGKRFEENLLASGFTPIKTRKLTFGIAYLYLAQRPLREQQ